MHLDLFLVNPRLDFDLELYLYHFHVNIFSFFKVEQVIMGFCVVSTQQNVNF